MRKTVFIVLCLVTVSAVLSAYEVEEWMKLTVKGEDLIRMGKYEEALDFFEKAEQLQKKSTRLYMNMAVAYKFLAEKSRKRNDREKYTELQFESVKQVLRIDPLHPDARFIMDTKLGILPAPVPFEKKETEEFYITARNALATGSLKAAAEILEKARKVEEHPEILKGLGMIAYQQQKKTEAAELLAASLKLNPIQYDIYMALGMMAEQDERYHQARLFYIKALAVYPHYFPARERISVVSKKLMIPANFFILIDPVPKADTEIKPDDTASLMTLSDNLKVNMFQLQCWLVYHRAVRKKRDVHNREQPGIPFKRNADIEEECLSQMLEYYSSHKENMGITLKQFDILSELKAKNLLKPAVFFYRWRDELAPEFIEYRKNHFDDLCRMLEDHI